MAPEAAGGAAAAEPPAGPRGSFLLAMQFLRNFARAGPCSFWSSAPNLHVTILSFTDTAKDGAYGTTATSVAATNILRNMALSRFPPLDPRRHSSILWQDTTTQIGAIKRHDEPSPYQRCSGPDQ